jgi:hypothetical protein
VRLGLARDCPRYSGGRYQPLELQAAAKGRHDRQAASAAGVLPSAMTERPAAWAPASEGGGGPVLGARRSGRNALNIAARKLQRARAELARLEDEN